MRLLLLISAFWLISANQASEAAEIGPLDRLAIGETFFIRSPIMAEDRRVNVYFPPGYSPAGAKKLPIMILPDGGMAEDFLHIAGLIQSGVSDKTMRPFLLVGIENTNRRRDTTGKTENPEDEKISAEVGGSERFRSFIRSELMPEIRRRYPTTSESAIIGESLAGLFVVETFLLEPSLFDTYIAIDPSLWWNNQWLMFYAESEIEKKQRSGKAVFIGSSSQPELKSMANRLTTALAACKSGCARFDSLQLPDETHATVFHPAALAAFRRMLPPGSEPKAVEK